MESSGGDRLGVYGLGVHRMAGLMESRVIDGKANDGSAAEPMAGIVDRRG